MDDSENYISEYADDADDREWSISHQRLDPFFAQFQQLPRQRSTRKVIRGEAFADVFAAEQAVQRAQEQVDDLDQQVTQALQEARAEGLAEGRREAAEEYARQIARLEKRVADFYQSAETTVAELGIRVAEMILGPQSLPAAPAQAARRVILAHINRQPHAIHVAPDAEQHIQDVLAELREEFPSARLPSPKLDKRLPSGRAMLVTRFGSVDLDIESQIRLIRENLRANAGRAAAEKSGVSAAASAVAAQQN